MCLILESKIPRNQGGVGEGAGGAGDINSGDRAIKWEGEKGRRGDGRGGGGNGQNWRLNRHKLMLFGFTSRIGADYRKKI